MFLPDVFDNSFVVGFLEILVALTVAWIAYSNWTSQYWKRRNLPELKPSLSFWRSINPFNKKRENVSLGARMQNFYNEAKQKNLKHCVLHLLSSPNYFLVDLDYIKNVLTKDFQHFTDRGSFYNERDDPLSAHLFTVGGQKWRNLRTKLSPTFTSGKMRAMFQTLADCEGSLHEMIEPKGQKAIDIKEVLGRFTTDIIGSCAFGLDFNASKDENSLFRVYGKKLFERNVLRHYLMIISQQYPSFGRFLRWRFTPKDVSDFFIKVVKDTVDYREKNSVARNDFLQLLIELKDNDYSKENSYQHDGKSLTLLEMAANCFVFFLAGFETSSTTMTFALYELAKNQEIQKKLRDEVNAVLKKHDGKITYDSINDMKYMNQVLDETLRKYPAVPFITRKCVKDYKVPDADVIIEKGTRVIIPIYGIHHDEKLYPDPEKFDPERFNEENKRNRHQYAHIPFGEGPRICIGMRFGLMQSKVGLTSLVKNYKLTVNEKTSQPLKLSVQSFIPTADGGIWLDAEKNE